MASKKLLSLQEKLFHYMKNKALNYEGKPSKELQLYRHDQEYYANRTFYLSNEHELLNSIVNSQVIYLGDFHTFDQSTRNLQRILKALLNNRHKFAVGMEMVHHDNQKFIDAYISKEISEQDFLKVINYHESWRFPWDHYKKIFELAQRENFQILGLNTSGTLRQRDAFASDVITRHIKNNPKVPILILYGELHIVPNKIPMLVMMQNASSHFRQTIIHQNLEEVYWAMEKASCTSSVVCYNGHEFNISSAPPWLKYESMAYWYENLWDEPDLNLPEYIVRHGFKLASGNIIDTFHLLTNEINHSLEISLNNEKENENEDLEYFNLYDHNNLNYVVKFIHNLNKSSLINFYEYLLTTNQNIILPTHFSYYIPNYSMSHLGHTIGYHLFNILLEKSGFEYNKLMKSKKSEVRFSLFLYQHIFGFFCSKLINPHRKCNMYSDFLRRIQLKHIVKLQKKATARAIDIIDLAMPISQALLKANLKLQYETAKLVGNFLGEYLFQNYHYNAHPSIIKFIKHDFLKGPWNQNKFEEVRKFILKDRDYHQVQKTFF